MSNSRDIALLKAEVRELQSIIRGMERARHASTEPRRVRLARKSQAGNVGDFYPVILQSGNLINRSAESVITAQKISGDYVFVFQQDSQWFMLEPFVNPPDADGCLCALIDLLKSKSHLADITAGEWQTLEGQCPCGAGPGIQCAHCNTDTTLDSYTVTVGGTASVVSTGNWPDASYQAAIDYLLANGPYTLQQNPLFPCAWEYFLCGIPGTVVGAPHDQEGNSLDLYMLLQFSSGVLNVEIAIRYTTPLPGINGYSRRFWDQTTTTPFDCATVPNTWANGSPASIWNLTYGGVDMTNLTITF